jgi:Uma2 family endonuclease
VATATHFSADATDPVPPSGNGLYEVVEGRIVEKVRGSFEAELATILVLNLGVFAKTNRLGKIVAEMLFLIDPRTNLQRRPDVAFVSQARWPINRRAPKESAWNVVPDLAIEVVSPTNAADDLLDKVEEYFRAGVKCVWLVYPNRELVCVYESATDVRILKSGDKLDGGAILPGFQLPVRTLFEDDVK